MDSPELSLMTNPGPPPNTLAVVRLLTALVAIGLGPLLAVAVTGCASTKRVSIGDPTTSLERAQAEIGQGKHQLALEELESLLKRPDAGPVRERARFWRTVCLRKLGYHEKSYESLKRFLEDYPISALAPKAEKELFELGVELLQGAGGGFLGIPHALGMSLSGAVVLRYLKDVSPNGRWAADAQRIIAQFYFDEGDFAMAITEYRALIDDHPGSIWQPLAEYRLPLCRLKNSRGAAYDRKLLEDALAGFQQYERRHPGGDYVKLARVHAKEVHNMLAEKNYRIADFYLDSKRIAAAVFYYKSTVQDYPETVWAQESLSRLQLVVKDYPDTEAARSAAETLDL